MALWRPTIAVQTGEIVITYLKQNKNIKTKGV